MSALTITVVFGSSGSVARPDQLTNSYPSFGLAEMLTNSLNRVQVSVPSGGDVVPPPGGETCMVRQGRSASAAEHEAKQSIRP